MDREVPKPEDLRQESQVTPEQPIPDEILIPKEAAKAFGRALEQALDLHFSIISKKIDENPTEEFSQAMKRSLDTFTKTIESFQSAQEVKIIARDKRENYPGQWDFEFSGEEPAENRLPQPGLAVLDESILKAPINPFSAALNHRLGNEFGPVLGYSELLSVLGTSDEKKVQGQAIHEQATQVISVFDPIMNARRIEMTTDLIDKNTTMNIVPKEHSQP